MKARRHAKKHPSRDRKFIPARTMSMIRWDESVARRRLKAAGKQDIEYTSLHAWGCGCCFLLPVKRIPPPAPPTSEERDCPHVGARGRP